MRLPVSVAERRIDAGKTVLCSGSIAMDASLSNLRNGLVRVVHWIGNTGSFYIGYT